MKELAPLQEKVALLIKRYGTLKEENASLKAMLGQKDEELARLQMVEQDLQQALAQASLNSHLQELPEEKKQQIKNRIDDILKMIEKNINLLN